MKPVTGIECKQYEFREKDLYKALPKGFKFITKPFYHQLLAVVFALQFDSCGLFFDMGLGKTKTVIDIIRALGIKRRILVTTIKAASYQWQQEFEKHAGDQYSTIVLDNEYSAEEIEEIISDDEYDVYITYYEQLSLRNKEKNDVRKYMVKAFERPWNVFITDESRKVMNYESKRTKVALYLSTLAKHNYPLTGLPIAKSLREIYTQQFLIDKGKQFGDYDEFIAEYFETKWNKWGHYPVTTTLPHASEEIQEKMYYQSLRFLKEECDDLPGKIYQNRIIKLSGDQLRFYRALKINEIKTVRRKEHNFKIKNILRKFHQICGGYLILGKDEETNKKVVKKFKTNVKFEALQDILLEELPDKKIIIYAAYVAEQKGLYRFVKKLGIPCKFIGAGMTAREMNKIQNRFNDTDKYRILICSYKVAGRALNLVGASYIINYSLDFDFEITKQSEDRIRRYGQKAKKVTYIRLICNMPADERVLEVYEEDQIRVEKSEDKIVFSDASTLLARKYRDLGDII